MPKMSRDHTVGKTREAQAQDRTATAVATQRETVQGEQQRVDRSDERQQDQRQDATQEHQQDERKENDAIRANDEEQAEARDQSRDQRRDEGQRRDEDRSRGEDQQRGEDRGERQNAAPSPAQEASARDERTAATQQGVRQDDDRDHARRDDERQDQARQETTREQEDQDHLRVDEQRHGEDRLRVDSNSETAGQQARAAQDQQNTNEEGFGKVLPYNEQARALYDEEGRRRTENEHIIPHGNLKAIATNPDTGDADYTRSHYRNDETVRVERDFALEKTAGNPDSDNARTARMKEALANGEGLHYRETMMDAIDNAKTARDRSNSVVSDEAIHEGALGQDANMFGMQRLEESARKVQKTGSVIEDFDIRETAGETEDRSAQEAQQQSADEQWRREEDERRASEKRVRRQRDGARSLEEALDEWEGVERT